MPGKSAHPSPLVQQGPLILLLSPPPPPQEKPVLGEVDLHRFCFLSLSIAPPTTGTPQPLITPDPCQCLPPSNQSGHLSPSSPSSTLGDSQPNDQKDLSHQKPAEKKGITKEAGGWVAGRKDRCKGGRGSIEPQAGRGAEKAHAEFSHLLVRDPPLPGSHRRKTPKAPKPQFLQLLRQQNRR